MGRIAKVFGGLGIAGLGVALSGGPAGAHISPDKDEVPANGFTDVTLTVPHGCEESPTRELSIEIPEGIIGASPEVHPGWDITVEEEQLAEPIEDEGEQITERVASITFTAQPGNELPAHYRERFTIGFQAPDTPGEYLFFNTVQRCVEGETAWIEEYTGEGEEPEHPAPALLITEAQGDGHGGGEEAGEDAEEGEGAAADDDAAGADSEDDEESSNGLAAAALVVGIVGLGVGGFALFRTRKPADTTS